MPPILPTLASRNSDTDIGALQGSNLVPLRSKVRSGERTLAHATTARARTVRAPAAPQRPACLPCRNGR